MNELLKASAGLHRHLCPRQVLGVRMGMLAGDLLGLQLPQSDKRLLTIVETDGCACDGIAAATGCWVGRRTMRVEDYGKVAATFVDTLGDRAIRIAPHPDARERAGRFAADGRNKWERMLLGYQRMPDDDLLVAQTVRLVVPVEQLVSRPGRRAVCDACGEEVINGREVEGDGGVLCRSCAVGGYYRLPAEAFGVLAAIRAPEHVATVMLQPPPGVSKSSEV